NPSDRRQTWVQRVIALPGDRVEVRDGRVLVNGKRLERDRVPAASLPPGSTPDGGAVFEESNAGSRYPALPGVGPGLPDFAGKPGAGAGVARRRRHRDLAGRRRHLVLPPPGSTGRPPAFARGGGGGGGRVRPLTGMGRPPPPRGGGGGGGGGTFTFREKANSP